MACRRWNNALVSLCAVCCGLHAAPAAEIDDARELFRTGHYAECADKAAQQIEQRAFSENWRVLKLRAELAIGRFEAALATLKQALEDYPFSVRLRWLGHRVYLFHGQPERAARLLAEIDQFVESASWRYRDPESRLALGQYYLHQGVDPRKVLETTYDLAKKQDPQFPDAFLAAGQLALQKHDYQLAAEELNQALKLDNRDPDVLVALSQAYAPSDDDKAQACLLAALAVNPDHVESLLLIANQQLDAERYAEAAETLQHVLEVHPLEPRVWAYRSLLAHLQGEQTTEELSRRAALAWWSTNPEVDYLIGRKLAQKYRFAEAAECQRRALAFDANYLPARIELSQTLLRLGDNDEGWRLAQQVNEQDGYNIVAHNLVTLHDEVARYRLLRAEGLAVQMEPREADIYGQQVLELLQRARTQLCQRYRVNLPGPIQVEIFPRAQDFAVRTFGLPGAEGFLGVCFGNVVTANSPASQADHPANWQAVLWHEFCHAVTLHKTKNHMPRWLSEGISVYEERREDARWGQAMSPAYREIILNGELTPLSQLSSAFLRPASPLHLQFAYYEASLAVAFLVERFGDEALQQILAELAVGDSIHEALARHTLPVNALDAAFEQYVRERAEQLAPGVDWAKPAPPPTTRTEWSAWNQQHRNNYWGLLGYAQALLQEREWKLAREPLEQLIKLYPDDDSEVNAYSLLAAAGRQLEDTETERTALEALTQIADDAAPAHLRLLELYAARQDWALVERHARQLLAIHPLLPAPHRHLVDAAEHLGHDQQAVESLQALLLLDPPDLANVHYRLAAHCWRSGSKEQARRHVLQAIEEAPRYRAACQLLLQILEAADAAPATDKQGE